MSKPLLNICSLAVQRLKNLASHSSKNAVFIGVEGGGCNGLKYMIEPLKSTPEKIDEKINIEGIDIIVCGQSLMYLIGTEITWKQDFMGEGFRFINPNATASCGCGETFSFRS